MLRRSTQYRFDGMKRPAPSGAEPIRRGESHAFGSIVWMAMLRLTATIFVAWYLKAPFEHSYYSEWWMITVGAIYGIAIYPAQIQYHYFKKTSKRLVEQTLCSSCRYFNADGLHCTKLDEHISEDYLPCEGEGWEPRSFEDL